MSAALRLALEACAVWLMPWRAARTIREQREGMDILLRTIVYLVNDSGHGRQQEELKCD